jgi:hypothetical protein
VPEPSLSVKLHEQWRQGVEKFDYFVLGAIGTLCAFIGQQLPEAQLSISPETLEALALLVLITAAIAGFKRIETYGTAYLCNQQCLHNRELAERLATAIAAGQELIFSYSANDWLTPEQATERINVLHEAASKRERELNEWSERAKRYYAWRNRLLLTGSLMLIAARLWRPYT